MKKLTQITKLLAVALTLTSATALKADEKEVKFSDLPANIQTAANAILKGAKVSEVEIEKEKGKVEYEIEFDKNKHEVSIKLDANGKLLETETKIELEEAPKAVQATITKLMGLKGVLEELEKVVVGTVTTYEVEFEIDEKETELLIDSKGKVLKKEEKEDDDDDDDDE